MTSALPACEVSIGGGLLALSPMMGREGDFDGDWQGIAAWRPRFILSLIEATEATLPFERLGLAAAKAGILHLHLPIVDFNVPSEAFPPVLNQVAAHLAAGERGMVHCMGGCGRSGMIALRLMIRFGEAPDAALARLRQLRPCAVETEAQRLWAERQPQSPSLSAPSSRLCAM